MPQRKQRGIHPSPERMEQLKKAYKEYTDPNVPSEQRPTQEDLEKKYGIPQATLQYWFRKFEVEGTEDPDKFKTLYPGDTSIRDERPPTIEQWKAAKSDRASLVTSRTTMKETITKLSQRAKNTVEHAYIIGNLIVERYGDLINLALAKGLKLEDFTIDVFNWFERKEQIEKQLNELQTTLTDLIPLTEANWRFQLKTNTLLDFARQCLNAKIYGARINIKEATRAFQTELEKIDKQTLMEMM